MPIPSPRLVHRIGRFLGHFGFVMLLALATAWAGTAMNIQLQGVAKPLALALLGIVCVAILTLRFYKRRHSWPAFALCAAAIGGWYQTIQPQQNRDWAPDVAHGVTAVIEGSNVTLNNVRDFDWVSETEANAHWETRQYDLTKLTTVDMITSTWGNPDIAHLIVSFGFADQRHIAFSVEIRKEVGESFSTVGGFFRRFELVLIAADEADVVKVRTNMRNEDVHLFPVKLTPDQGRALFLSYLDLGNQLAKKPEFYNTVTANCTSIVYGLVQVVKPDMPLDRRLLLSGQLPEYIDELGGLPGKIPMDQRRAEAAISALGQNIGPGQDFSQVIRRR